jgi:hypothetical protein
LNSPRKYKKCSGRGEHARGSVNFQGSLKEVNNMPRQRIKCPARKGTMCIASGKKKNTQPTINYVNGCYRLKIYFNKECIDHCNS